MLKAKLSGQKRAFRQLRQIVPDVKDELENGLRKNAEEMADLARGFAPKVTGDYANSIKAKPVEKVTGIPAWGVFAEWLWHFIEFGTRAARYGERVGVRSSDVRQNKTRGRLSYRNHPGTPARPHMWPAYRILRKRMKSRTTRSINKAVKRAIKKR